MPWRREQTYPYRWEDVYVPSPTGRLYYSDYQRTPEEMARAYERAVTGARRQREREREQAANRPRDNWRNHLRPGFSGDSSDYN